ncbi:MAG: glycerol-3-phosphate cytidylyltransferase [Firmicutes bacterium]|nr:glycerol-3-phosphate cytidylyltransferase [Bacillota bacterium]
MSSIGVLGAGTWGTALARMLCNSGHDVMVWSIIEEEVKVLSSERRHKNLPNSEIPEGIVFTNDLSEACRNRDILVFAVPSVYVRSTAASARPFIPDGQIIVDVAKGIEPDTLFTLSEVIRDEVRRDGKHDGIKVAALSGPTHAEEVALDLPSTIVSACEDISVAELIQDAFTNSCMRVYTNTDVRGVELCGALKNIIALASGISAGLGYGDNTKAALITRGLAEIERLGTAMGCAEQTFSGLAGIGDLIVTATSRHSRNNRCGYLIGQGYSPEDAVRQVGMVVEGINALPAAMRLAEKYSVDMPIIRVVDDIVKGNINASDAVALLMGREKKAELLKPVCNSDLEKTVLRNFTARGDQGMKRVITYGTFDLLHYGHINLLRRAKALGDYLIVVISSDEFNWNEKHKKCYFSYEQRKALVEAVRYVDLVIPEESWSQKRSDMHEYHIDTFVMGDDWKGKFDFLKEEGVEVVYLPRTPEISSSQIKKDLYDANAVDGESKVNHDEIDTDPGK